MTKGGAYGIRGQKTSNTYVSKDTLEDILSTAIWLRSYDQFSPSTLTCDSSTIDSNYIHNIGILEGMGQSGNSQYMGMHTIGLKVNITNNVIRNVGYIGIFYNGRVGSVKYNYVDTFCINKVDGGAINTYCDTFYYPLNYDSGTIVRKNIAQHGVGYLGGTSGALFNTAAGYYQDSYTHYVLLDSNTASDCAFACIFGSLNDSLNRFYDNTVDDSLGDCVYTYSNTNIETYKRNILYQRSTSRSCFYINVGNLAMSIDSNYYINPVTPTNAGHYVSTFYSLAGWQAVTGYDPHGYISPTRITSNVGILYTNPSHTSLVVPLTGNWRSATGIYYVGSITLGEFESAILFPSLTPQSNYSQSFNHSYNKYK
jgi:hypothetical protein